MKTREELIAQLNDSYKHNTSGWVGVKLEDVPTLIQALTSVKSESAEEYKTQVVIPIEIRHKNYCDLNGKIIPTEFILDKEHFFYGGYGYIVLHDFANKSEAMKWISVEDLVELPKEEVLCVNKQGYFLVGYLFEIKKGIYNCNDDHQELPNVIKYQILTT